MKLLLASAVPSHLLHRRSESTLVQETVVLWESGMGIVVKLILPSDGSLLYPAQHKRTGTLLQLPLDSNCR